MDKFASLMNFYNLLKAQQIMELHELLSLKQICKSNEFL